MLYQVPYSLFRLQVLLTTNMTITTDYICLTIKAIFFFSFL